MVNIDILNCVSEAQSTCYVCVCVLTFRASSGTVSSPLTTVNRLVCETVVLRKYWPQLHIHTYFRHSNSRKS